MYFTKTSTTTTETSPPIYIVATVPLLEKKTRKSPISLHISKSGTNTPLGCYIYSITNPRTNQTHQSVLNNAQETLVDMAKKIGLLVSKKYQVPTYVSVSGEWSFDELLPAVKSTVAFLDSCL